MSSRSRKFLRLRQVSERVGLPPGTLYDRIAAGCFPKQISLGGRAVGWLEEDIDDWIEQRITESRSEPTVIGTDQRA